ncbi:MAG: hypothetical protein V4584_04210 [Verrucomicrobiota bacterium]
MKNRGDEPSIFKYPLGDQGRLFVFTCCRGASRMSFSAAERHSIVLSRTAVKVMPDPASNVLRMNPDASPLASDRIGQSA